MKVRNRIRSAPVLTMYWSIIDADLCCKIVTKNSSFFFQNTPIRHVLTALGTFHPTTMVWNRARRTRQHTAHFILFLAMFDQVQTMLMTLVFPVLKAVQHLSYRKSINQNVSSKLQTSQSLFQWQTWKNCSAVKTHPNQHAHWTLYSLPTWRFVWSPYFTIFKHYQGFSL